MASVLLCLRLLMGGRASSSRTWEGAQGVAVASRVHVRTDLHLARKTWHLGMGVVAVSLFLLTGMSRGFAVALLGAILIAALAVEALRLRNPQFNAKVIKSWGPLMRQCELNRVSGTPFYLCAMLLTVAIFPKPIAALSILYLACGDPIASIFGILYGDRGPRFANGKSLIGSVAGIVACFAVGVALLSGWGWTNAQMMVVATLGAMAGGCAELLPIEVDDNFSIPLVSGFVLWLSFIVLGVNL